jgi:predicted nucleic acid-binding protein
MAMVTIDASVWIAARFQVEPEHDASAACIVEALAGRDDIVLPWLAWVECVAAVARKTGDDALAIEAGQQLRAQDAIRWVPLDEAQAVDATATAAACRLRAADAVYVAVARRFGATLVTLDRELMQRCVGHVQCMTPDTWVHE